MAKPLTLRTARRHRLQRCRIEDERFAKAKREAAPIAPRPAHALVSLPLHEARRLSLGCADVLCWMAGFAAARPEATDNPLGIWQVRRLREFLDSAISKAEGRPLDEDLPF